MGRPQRSLLDVVGQAGGWTRKRTARPNATLRAKGGAASRKAFVFEGPAGGARHRRTTRRASWTGRGPTAPGAGNGPKKPAACCDVPVCVRNRREGPRPSNSFEIRTRATHTGASDTFPRGFICSRGSPIRGPVEKPASFKVFIHRRGVHPGSSTPPSVFFFGSKRPPQVHRKEGSRSRTSGS